MTTRSKAAVGKAATKTVEAAVAAGTETVETIVKTSTETATQNYDKAIASTREQASKASDAFFKGYDEFAVLGKENVDAVMQSGTIFAKGVEQLGKEVIGYAQTSVDKNMAVANKLMTCTTVKELLDLQAEWARASLDSFVAEGSKLGEMSVALSSEAFQPLQAQANKAVKSILKPASLA